jgi:hypothetical protein
MNTISLHNCEQCNKRVHFDTVTKWECYGCGIQNGPLVQVSDQELQTISQELNPKKRRLIICHGKKDPSIDDENWKNDNVETLDIDPSKEATYTLSIKDSWPENIALYNQFDEIMLKNCSMYALFDNVPTNDFEQVDPYNLTEEEEEQEEEFWESQEGEVELEANARAWYNISLLLKDGGKLYHNHFNTAYAHLHPQQDEADVIDAINVTLKYTGIYYIEDSDGMVQLGGNPEYFLVYTKHIR